MFTLLAFLATCFTYILRVNINLVITSMVNNTALATGQHGGPYQWDTVVKNDVIGLFYAGYMILQMPGGRLTELWGGKKVIRDTIETFD